MPAMLEQPAQRESTLERLRRREAEINSRLAAIPAVAEEADREAREELRSIVRRAKTAVTGAPHPITVRDTKLVALDEERRRLEAEQEALVGERLKAEQAERASQRVAYMEAIAPLHEAVRDALAEFGATYNLLASVYTDKILPAANALAAHRGRAPDQQAREAAIGPLEPWPLTFRVFLDHLHKVATDADLRERPAACDRGLLLPQLVAYKPVLLEKIHYRPDIDTIYERPGL